MLNQVRGALKGVVAWFIIILLILAFALWGVPELRNFAQRTPLQVGDETFSSQAIVSEFNLQMAQIRDRMGGRFTREDAIAAGLGDEVVASLATRSVLAQEAEKMGLAAPRDMVRDYLRSDERFHNPATGQFDQFVLQSILSNNNLTVSQFEAMIREDLIRNQLIGSLAGPAPAPAEFARLLLLREVENRRVGYVTVTGDMAGVPAEPTPDALRAYYEANEAAFTAPEYRTFTLAEFRIADFAEGLAPPDEELREIYEANRERLYSRPERRTLYQATFETEAEAEAATAALRQGEPFESVAADQGLSLQQATFTEVTQSDMIDPAVGQAAFAADLAEGDVAGPVRSLFGWTVIQVAGIVPPETQSFEDVRDEIAAQFTDQDARRRMFEAIEQVEEARDQGTPLMRAAEDAGAEPVRIGPVDAGSLGPGGVIVPDISAEALAAAFRLQEGDESEAVDLADGAGYFFVQVDEVREAALRPFEDVEADVEQRWRRDERRERIAAAVEQIVDATKEGASLAEAVEPFNRAVIETVLDRRTAPDGFSRALIEEAFVAAPGAVIAGGAGSSDAQTVVEIREVVYDRAAAGPGQQAAFAQYIGYQLNQELVEAYVDALRNDYGVKIDRGALAQIFSDQL